MYYLYILRSLRDGKLYIGATNNLSRRIKQHNDGFSKSTRYRRPFILIYSEHFASKNEAMKREWCFKNTGEGNKLMRKLIEECERKLWAPKGRLRRSTPPVGS
ncbi:GIY-YIG nuclease family protein [Candidatus Microgenomates bacterium]|nr:GIY-YIG nuclease family protein [Candidatus Microgenomates bacterium]